MRPAVRFVVILVLTLAALAVAGADAAIVRPEVSGGREISWTEYVRSLWPILVTCVGLIIAGLLLGLSTRFATVLSFNALKGRVDKLEERDTHQDLEDRGREARLKRLEEICVESPTRGELQEDISELSERMRGVEVGLEGLRTQGNTTNVYLQTLIERGLSR